MALTHVLTDLNLLLTKAGEDKELNNQLKELRKRLHAELDNDTPGAALLIEEIILDVKLKATILKNFKDCDMFVLNERGGPDIHPAIKFLAKVQANLAKNLDRAGLTPSKAKRKPPGKKEKDIAEYLRDV